MKRVGQTHSSFMQIKKHMKHIEKNRRLKKKEWKYTRGEKEDEKSREEWKEEIKYTTEPNSNSYYRHQDNIREREITSH